MNEQTSYFRVLFDLQACQSKASYNRGVGNYSHELSSALVGQSTDLDIFALVSDALSYKVSIDGLPESRTLRLPALPQWDTARDFIGGEQDALDSLVHAAFTASVKADVIHLSHVFEGCVGERIALPSISRRASGQIISATLYDTIPLIYPDYYLKDINVKKWYTARCSWLQQADLLLAISESSRRDAIALLGIDSWRIVTVHGGVSSKFRILRSSKKLFRKLSIKYKIKPNFVFYTGGDDFRKNLDGLIRGFYLIPESVRKDWQLVIACSIRDERIKELLRLSKSLGLNPNDVKFLGFVPDNDLVALYNMCGLFVFPSLYEGLGLPVLEAMACGAPVIGGNNSSIRELIARPDCLFDATSSESIASLMTKSLSDFNFAKDLREYGSRRVKEFTWSNTASKTMGAFEDALDRTRSLGIKCSLQGGWLKRKKLALFTPLPPAKSGIADYNKLFLPYLKRYFDIDIYIDKSEVDSIEVTALFRIFSAENFDKVASLYDVILYDFGNSEFHTYMLPILEAYPGVVCLHDAYLSGMFGYLDFFLGKTSYELEMLHSHKSAARKYFAPLNKNSDPITESMISLPCTKKILDNSIGIISHSPFNLKIALSHYPERWQAPYRIISQPALISGKLPKKEKSTIRASLGFSDNDFIVSSFGHIAWTKMGDLIVKAFLSMFGNDPRGHLVFVGELASDEFGAELREAIEKSNCKNRIRITGFISEDCYSKYLQISDVSIQLRKNSRGGTPKGVLDCLSNGLPVIVNNGASYKDYPDDVLVKLSSEPSLDEIIDSFKSIYFDASRKESYSKMGLGYVTNNHNPASCAAMYAAFIDECIERHRLLKNVNILDAFAPHISGCNSPDQAGLVGLNSLQQIQPHEFERRRLFIDVSYTSEVDSETGIARVVKEIIREFYCTDISDEFEVIAVELQDAKLVKSSDWLFSKGYISSAELFYLKNSSSVEFKAGDILLMLDSSWGRYSDFWGVFKLARASFVQIYTAIYDLLPITLSDCFIDGGKDWFESFLKLAINSSDGLICISKSVATELNGYINSLGLKGKSPRVGHWHLGADFVVDQHVKVCRNAYSGLFLNPFLLMVGTIEPRKSHKFALAAMEILWEEESELSLCIVGKEGWMSGDLMKILREHPLLNKKLFLFESPSDEDIKQFYSHAQGLLFISKGEGFGLPIVEAANYNLPVICSDLDVFREIAGNSVTYVKMGSAEKLARDIKDWLEKFKANSLPDISGLKYLTWNQSCKELLKAVEDWGGAVK